MSNSNDGGGCGCFIFIVLVMILSALWGIEEKLDAQRVAPAHSVSR